MSLEAIFVVLLFLAMLLAVLPGIPSVPLMFVLTVVYGFIDGFETLSPWHLAIFGGIALLSVGVDFLSGLIGVKFGKGSKHALLYGFVGLVIGLVLFPPLGGLVGLFAGAFVAEMVQFNDARKALRTASFSVIGAAVGAGVNFILAIAYVITFLVIVF